MKKQSLILACLAVAGLPFATGDAVADFPLNFSPNDAGRVSSSANIDCRTSGSGGSFGMGGMFGGSCSGTPFLQELVSSGGNQYYHVIIGDPDSSDGFAYEYYLRALSGSTCWYGCANQRASGMGMGMGGSQGTAPLSSSSGTTSVSVGMMMSGATGNGSDPLSSNASFTGNATGRPDRAQIRMVLRDNQMTQEYLKATEANKPKITQSLNGNNMTMDFNVDMSAIDYNTDSVQAGFEMTQSIADTSFPEPSAGIPQSGNFDIADFGATATITAGRFTYTPGSGDGGSFGDYNYFDDSYDAYNVDWSKFCDPSQNNSAC